MPNLEWEVPHTLVTPYGELELNVTDPDTLRRYQILQSGYRMGPTLRVTADNLSQADGSVPHPRWLTGVTALMTVRFQIQEADDDEPEFTAACGQDLREMYELLALHLNSIRELVPFDAGGSTPAEQRLYWLPTGYGDQRLLNEILLLTWLEPERDDVETSVTFSVESPFPYAIDSTEVDVPISGTVVITNEGNSDFMPVVEVTASSAFTITNHSVLDDDGNPLSVVFNASLPGGVAVGGAGAEIDFFRGTIFAGGSDTELIQGIDPTLSDFFPLIPGTTRSKCPGRPRRSRRTTPGCRCRAGSSRAFRGGSSSPTSTASSRRGRTGCSTTARSRSRSATPRRSRAPYARRLPRQRHLDGRLPAYRAVEPAGLRPAARGRRHPVASAARPAS
jgi:hypothetical protein